MSRGLWLSVAGAAGLAFAVVMWDPSSPQPPSGPEWHSSTTAGASQPAATAREVFVQRCRACHGDGGDGDGPAAASLNPRPRRFADSAWQAAVTDDQIETIIKYGGIAVGRSAAMPSHSDLDTQRVAGLRTLVRAFQR